ncbi:MAG: hypothetical protein Q4G67_02350, partial [Actinomycetia bacterium]|nr:hypothetical protein [Actinomycetes bacterium]
MHSAPRPLVALFSGFALILMLGLSAIYTPVADAFIDAEIPPATGQEPVGEVTLTREVLTPGTGGSGNTPGWGGSFRSIATVDLTNMTEPGVDHTAVLTVTADSNTPWVSVPTASNFTGVGGTPVLSNCTTTSCTATFSNVTQNGQIVFTSPTQNVPPETEPLSGAIVAGTARVEITTNPTVVLEPQVAQFHPDPTNTCTGEYEYATHVAEGGAWLMDMHFADGHGNGLVQLDDPATIRPHYDPNAGRNRIQVVDADGNDITAQVFNRPNNTPRYISPDPSAPYFPGDLIQTSYPNAVWLDSMNWNYDPDTWTGDTWLPAGSTITVWRGVTYDNCSNGIALDWNRERPFGVSIEVARLGQSTSSNVDVDSWNLPGNPVGTQCENIYRSTRSGGIFQWSPDTGRDVLTVKAAGGGEIPALAISPRNPELLYYYQSGSGGGWFKLDTSTANPTPQSITPPMPGASSNHMAFDANGTLWALAANQASNLQLFSLPHGSTTWQSHGTVVSSSWNTQGDIVFDGEGNMHILTVGTAPQIRTIPASELTKTSGIVVPSGRTITGVSQVYGYGLAYGPDGRLWMSNTNFAGTTDLIYELDVATARASNGRATSTSSSTDMASCAFGPPAPAFAVQKSVINRDGSISAPGTTGNPVTVNPDGTVTVDYLVTVRNVSAVDGSFADITDTVTLPAGFAITDVRLQNASQGTSGSFTIGGEALAAGQSRAYVVSVSGRAADLSAVNWNLAGTCNTEGAGTPAAGGFFNLVRMAGDSDGPDNNDACVPVERGGANLALIKQILDSDGNHLPGHSDAQYFTLFATPTVTGDPGLAGSSATSGAVGPSGPVLPGTFSLSERENVPDMMGEYTPGTWTCVDSTGASVPVVGSQVTVDDGDNVTCTITNRQAPPVPTNPAISLTKTADRTEGWVAGQTVTYTFVATNTGD